MRKMVLIVLTMTMLLTAWADGGLSAVTCPVRMVEVERLVDLNVARSGHQTFWIDGEAVVMGGHTSGFVPTPTAEYYRDGRWQKVAMVYTHDQGCAYRLPNGRVMVAGGHEQPLGIGLTFTVELYDPATHRFEGYGCLEQKRGFASCMALDSGRVVIAGNWYAADSMELFDGSRQNVAAGAVSQQRSTPYVLRTAKDNVMVFSGIDARDHVLDTIRIDRLHGGSFVDSLLLTWRPQSTKIFPHFDDAFIGSEAGGHYSYLLPAFRSDGQMALLRTDGECFGLLATDHPIPMRSEWGDIRYFSYVVADTVRHRAYVMGDDDKHRLYVLAVDYLQHPARVSLCYTEPQEDVGLSSPVLTGDGCLLMAGGIQGVNFTPYASAVVVHVGDDGGERSLSDQMPWWLWLLAVVVLGGLAYIIIYKRRRGRRRLSDVADGLGGGEDDQVPSGESLMEQIRTLMDEQQPYLDSELKVSDVGRMLRVNGRYVSDCINQQCGCSFSVFINRYRVAYAQQLLRRQPELKISAVAQESGFATETSFFRNFKLLAGMTPKEWLASLED